MQINDYANAQMKPWMVNGQRWMSWDVSRGMVLTIHVSRLTKKVDTSATSLELPNAVVCASLC